MVVVFLRILVPLDNLLWICWICAACERYTSACTLGPMVLPPAHYDSMILLPEQWDPITPTYTLGPCDTPTCTLGNPLILPAHCDPITPTNTLGPHYSHLHAGTPFTFTCTLGPRDTPTRTPPPLGCRIGWLVVDGMVLLWLVLNVCFTPRRSLKKAIPNGVATLLRATDYYIKKNGPVA